MVVFKGMIKFATNRPPLSTSTAEPKLIFSAGIWLPLMVMPEMVMPPPVVKSLPVTVIDWLGRAVAGDRVIEGLDDCSPGSAKAIDSPATKTPTEMSQAASAKGR